MQFILIIQVPVASIQAEGGVAFNRVSWTPSGTHITAGDDAGKIWVYEVAEVIPMILYYNLLLLFYKKRYFITIFRQNINDINLKLF